MSLRSLALAMAATGMLMAAAPALPTEAKPAPRPCVSMNDTNADLRDVLKRLASKMGRNLYVHPGVQGTVTLAVRDVPADSAFQLVLKMQTEDYDYKVVGNTIVVAAPDKLAEIPDDLMQ